MILAMPSLRLPTVLLAIVASVTWASSSAQMYETPETQRQAAEAKKQADEALRKEQTIQAVDRGLREKEAEAMAHVGKTYVYVPDPNARSRIFFYEKMPPSSFSQDPQLQFAPLKMTTFVVIGMEMPPPVLYPIGKDEYLLKIKFPDGKEGYVNVEGPVGLKRHLTKEVGEPPGEYVKETVSTEESEVLVARETAAREKAAREAQLAKDRTDREQRAAASKAAQDRARKAAERKREEKALRDEMAAQYARPSPRLGMSQSQVINGTNWGRPQDVNRTITSAGTREQWVYRGSRYLYFDNGVLTAIQD